MFFFFLKCYVLDTFRLLFYMTHLPLYKRPDSIVWNKNIKFFPDLIHNYYIILCCIMYLLLIKSFSETDVSPSTQHLHLRCNQVVPSSTWIFSSRSSTLCLFYCYSMWFCYYQRLRWVLYLNLYKLSDTVVVSPWLTYKLVVSISCSRLHVSWF